MPRLEVPRFTLESRMIALAPSTPRVTSIRLDLFMTVVPFQGRENWIAFGILDAKPRAS